MCKSNHIVLSILLILILVLGNSFGCAGGSNGHPPAEKVDVKVDVIQEITYSFGDSSVPPEYHRSYNITITTDMLRIVVDSYGDILADEEYEITNEQFNNVEYSLESNEIGNCPSGGYDYCTGGTSEGISYSDGENEIFSGTVYHCGGKDTGDLCGDITSFAYDVKDLVPELEELLQ